MRKNILIICLCVLMLVFLCSCGESDQYAEPGDVIQYNATASIVDSWKDTEGDAAIYVTSIVLHSDDFYDCPQANDVNISTDEGYQVLTDFVPGAEIVVYNLNESLHQGVYTYMKIKSPKLLDTKKIYVNLEGPVEYQNDIDTSEKYLEVNGSMDGWCNLLVQLSEYDKQASKNWGHMIDSNSYGVIELVNKDRDQFYYSYIDDNMIINNDKMLKKVFIDKLTNSDINQIVDQLIQDGQVANIVNGEIEIINIDDKLEIYSCVDNGELFVGFKTTDGSNFNEYNGEIPEVIVYNEMENCVCCFIISNN